MAEIVGEVIVHVNEPGTASWDVAAASEIVNTAIQQELLDIRRRFPGQGGTIALRIRVTVDSATDNAEGR